MSLRSATTDDYKQKKRRKPFERHNADNVAVVARRQGQNKKTPRTCKRVMTPQPVAQQSLTAHRSPTLSSVDGPSDWWMGG